VPSINLRLTEAEHEELRAWAFEGRRSIQREIVFRLFVGLAEGATETGKHRIAASDTDGAAPSPDDQAAPTGKEKEAGTLLSPGEDALPSPSASPNKRFHPCKHHIPPHRVCNYCDIPKPEGKK
jgi:hypothetical protein